jgi:hypothetical protein
MCAKEPVWDSRHSGFLEIDHVCNQRYSNMRQREQLIVPPPIYVRPISRRCPSGIGWPTSRLITCADRYLSRVAAVVGGGGSEGGINCPNDRDQVATGISEPTVADERRPFLPTFLLVCCSSLIR